ncbi:HMG box [Aphelenchoides fujianensis]|nr:HMG box [Aphelenchoides fujianensis]
MHRARQMPTPARSTGRFQEPHVRAPLRPPDRPLVPYMRFSRKMWPRVRAENPEVQLLEIGKIIGQMWRESSDAEKAVYQQEYEQEKLEYDRTLKAYQAAVEQQQLQASRQIAQGAGLPKLHAGHQLPPAATIQPVDEEDPFEMTRKRQCAARYDRDNRLMADLFTGACLPDTRTMVPQNRIDILKKQASSLSSHQKKLNEELERLEENFQRRKRTLEENSEKFSEGMKKLKDERPVFTEEKYREYVQQWMEHIRADFADFKAKRDDPNHAAAADVPMAEADEAAAPTVELTNAAERVNPEVAAEEIPTPAAPKPPVDTAVEPTEADEAKAAEDGEKDEPPAEGEQAETKAAEDEPMDEQPTTEAPEEAMETADGQAVAEPLVAEEAADQPTADDAAAPPVEEAKEAAE